jgi:hypothetical protein
VDGKRDAGETGERTLVEYKAITDMLIAPFGGVRVAANHHGRSGRMVADVP